MSMFHPLSLPLLTAWIALLAQTGTDRAAPHTVEPTRFSVRVTNVSTPMTLKLSDGSAAPAPTAPVLWIVHEGSDPIFTVGKRDRGQGLEQLAEDGDPSALAAALKGRPGIVAVGFVNVPVGAGEPGPILPGSSYEVEFEAMPGAKLTIAMMFGQSNDLFYAPNGSGIELFEGTTPRAVDITSELVLWDAGTEVNQEPGLGPDQAPRQAAPNTGADEHGVVDRVHDRFRYPAVGQVIRVMLGPAKAGGMSRVEG